MSRLVPRGAFVGGRFPAMGWGMIREEGEGGPGLRRSGPRDRLILGMRLHDVIWKARFVFVYKNEADALPISARDMTRRERRTYEQKRKRH